MFKQLFDNGEKVFSADLGPSHSVKAVLGKTLEKKGLSTATLLLEGEQETFLLFILEDDWYALYRLSEQRLTPFPFAEFLKQCVQLKGTATLFRLSPVLFKSLLIMSNKPTLVSPISILDPDRLLDFLSKSTQDAVLAVAEKEPINLFYFYQGKVRDFYFSKPLKNFKNTGSAEKALEAALAQDCVSSVMLFDTHDIQPAADCNAAMQELRDLPESASSGQSDLEDEEKTPVPLDLSKAEPEEQDAQGSDPKNIWVEVLSGSRAGFLIRFSRKPVKLGRGKVDVQLNDPQISRVHAELEWTPTGLFIRDRNSTNGLFVNNEKVKEIKLALDDEIRLGDISLKAVPAS